MKSCVACIWFAWVSLAAASDEISPVTKQDLGRLAATSHDAGARLHDAGNYKDAEMLYLRSIETWQRAYGAGHPGLLRLWNALAALYFDAGQLEKADAATQRSFEIQRASPHAMPPLDESITFIHLGSIRHAMRRFAESESAFLNAERILPKDVESYSGSRANVWNNLGALYADWGRPELAASYLERSVSALGEACSQVVATTLFNMAAISGRIGRSEAAEANFERAADCARRTFGMEHRQTAGILSSYATFLRKSNRKREAARLDAESREITARAAAIDGSRYLVNAAKLKADAH